MPATTTQPERYLVINRPRWVTPSSVSSTERDVTDASNEMFVILARTGNVFSFVATTEENVGYRKLYFTPDELYDYAARLLINYVILYRRRALFLQ